MIRKYRYTSIFAVIVFILIISNIYYFRIDLTSDKRYTLSDKTVEFVKNTDRQIYIEIYLDGQLPPNFERLKRRTCELLNELNKISEDKIHYRLIDPSSIADSREKKELVSRLLAMGIQPTNINHRKSSENISQQLIFPGLIMWDNKTETSVNLLKNNPSLSADDNINHSIEALEYEIISAVRILFREELKHIGFLSLHREAGIKETSDIGKSLANHYIVNRISCEDIKNNTDKYSAVIIAQPKDTFSEEDKFIIDQYLMGGGKLLWLVDKIKASTDSLTVKQAFIAAPFNLNLDDILFNYGVRINYNLILDSRAALIPVNTSVQGEKPKFTPMPWFYAPLAVNNPKHPVSKDINPVRMDFANSIDTVGGNTDIKKTVLLHTSEYSATLNAPAKVDMSIVNKRVSPKVFNQSKLITAVALSGRFPSAYRHRNGDCNTDNFRKLSEPTKMIVVSDGDVIKNKIQGKGDNAKIIPLGYDRYSGQMFGNKAFIMNAVNYLCDDDNWMSLRKREFKLNILNKEKLRAEKLKWQIINLLIPLLFVLIFGGLWYIIRKKRYSQRRI